MALFNEGDYPAGKAFRDPASGNWVLVPENVTPDTPVHIYYTGAGSKGNTPSIIKQTYFQDENFDGIVIVCSNGDGWWSSEQAVQNQIDANRRIVSEIEEEYGVSLNNRNVYGSSIGDKFAMEDFARQCEEGTDGGVLCLTGASTAQASTPEGYSPRRSLDVNGDGISEYYDPNRAYLSEEDYEALKGKTVLVFERGDISEDSTYYDQYAPENYTYVKALNEHGANVYLVKCKGSSHDQLSTYPLQQGLFNVTGGSTEEAIAYLSENENYLSIERCVDVDSNTWETVSAEDVCNSIASGRNGGLYMPDFSQYMMSDDFTITPYDSNVMNTFSPLTSMGALGISYLTNPELQGSLHDTNIISDLSFVSQYMSNIRSNIGQTSFLSSLQGLSFRGSDGIPACLNGFIEAYFNAVGALLNELAQETSSVISFAQAYADMDADFGNKAGQINAVDADGNVTPVNPLSYSKPSVTTPASVSGAPTGGNINPTPSTVTGSNSTPSASASTGGASSSSGSGSGVVSPSAAAAAATGAIGGAAAANAYGNSESGTVFSVDPEKETNSNKYVVTPDDNTKKALEESETTSSTNEVNDSSSVQASGAPPTESASDSSNTGSGTVLNVDSEKETNSNKYVVTPDENTRKALEESETSGPSNQTSDNSNTQASSASPSAAVPPTTGNAVSSSGATNVETPNMNKTGVAMRPETPDGTKPIRYKRFTKDIDGDDVKYTYYDKKGNVVGETVYDKTDGHIESSYYDYVDESGQTVRATYNPDAIADVPTVTNVETADMSNSLAAIRPEPPEGTEPISYSRFTKKIDGNDVKYTYYDKAGNVIGETVYDKTDGHIESSYYDHIDANGQTVRATYNPNPTVVVTDTPAPSETVEAPVVEEPTVSVSNSEPAAPTNGGGRPSNNSGGGNSSSASRGSGSVGNSSGGNSGGGSVPSYSIPVPEQVKPVDNVKPVDEIKPSEEVKPSDVKPTNTYIDNSTKSYNYYTAPIKPAEAPKVDEPITSDIDIIDEIPVSEEPVITPTEIKQPVKHKGSAGSTFGTIAGVAAATAGIAGLAYEANKLMKDNDEEEEEEYTTDDNFEEKKDENGEINLSDEI